MSNILVIGDCGYVGSVLVPYLVSKDHKVSGIDNYTYQEPSFVDKNYTSRYGDMRQPRSHWFNGIDTVINLGAFSNDPTANAYPELNKRLNVDAAVRCALVARDHGVSRFIQASSTSVYDGADAVICTEETALHPISHYPKSKYDVEQELKRFETETFHPVSLRKGTIYGVSPRMRFDLVINAMLRDALTKGTITVHNGGAMSRPMLSISNAAKAYELVATCQAKLVTGKVFNVVDGNFTIAELALAVVEAIHRRTSRYTNLAFQTVSSVRDYRASGKKFAELFGPLDNTLTSNIDAMLDEYSQWTLADFYHPVHENIKWVNLVKEIESKPDYLFS